MLLNSVLLHATLCYSIYLCCNFVLTSTSNLTVQEAVDIFGLSALDRLFCFMIVRELQRFLKYLQRNLMRLEPFVKELKNFVKIAEDPNSLIRKFVCIL